MDLEFLVPSTKQTEREVGQWAEVRRATWSQAGPFAQKPATSVHLVLSL